MRNTGTAREGEVAAGTRNYIIHGQQAVGVQHNIARTIRCHCIANGDTTRCIAQVDIAVVAGCNVATRGNGASRSDSHCSTGGNCA